MRWFIALVCIFFLTLSGCVPIQTAQMKPAEEGIEWYPYKSTPPSQDEAEQEKIRQAAEQAAAKQDKWLRQKVCEAAAESQVRFLCKYGLVVPRPAPYVPLKFPTPSPYVPLKFPTPPPYVPLKWNQDKFCAKFGC